MQSAHLKAQTSPGKLAPTLLNSPFTMLPSRCKHTSQSRSRTEVRCHLQRPACNPHSQQNGVAGRTLLSQLFSNRWSSTQLSCTKLSSQEVVLKFQNLSPPYKVQPLARKPANFADALKIGIGDFDFQVPGSSGSTIPRQFPNPWVGRMSQCEVPSLESATGRRF